MTIKIHNPFVKLAALAVVLLIFGAYIALSLQTTFLAPQNASRKKAELPSSKVRHQAEVNGKILADISPGWLMILDDGSIVRIAGVNTAARNLRYEYYRRVRETSFAETNFLSEESGFSSVREIIPPTQTLRYAELAARYVKTDH